MNDTPTPRTDAELFLCRGMGIVPTLPKQSVPAYLARTLETELNEAREQLKKTRKHLKDANRGAEINAHALRINTDRLAFASLERDAWKEKYIQQNKDLGCEMMDPNGTIWDYAKKIQTELAAVTKQLNEARDTIAMLTNTLRNNNDASRAGYEELERELAAVTEQRDRLAEALESVKCELGVPQPEYPSPVSNAYWIADEALQSLNQDHTGDANDMIAATTTKP